uniref:Metalloendopeptidase n=1 Tax=Callorhinchus milii TaxID=7868 RepID=A0A4W3II72_CALMI
MHFLGVLWRPCLPNWVDLKDLIPLFKKKGITACFLANNSPGKTYHFFSDSMKLEDMDSNEPDVVTRIMEVNKHLIPSQRSTLKCPYFPSSCLWPHSIDGNVYIPYSLEQTESQKKTIIAALSEFNSLTCIKFKRRKYEYSYIRITAQQGCWAAIGRIGGPQPLSLEIPSCLWQGVIQHELMHSIGFIHEHCRNDRDQYVTVHLENVFNFEKMDSNNLGMKYDYGSLMHYGRYLFSKNSLPTILPKPNPDTIIGQIYGFSVNDINKIRKLYNCSKCLSSFLKKLPFNNLLTSVELLYYNLAAY